MLSEELSTDMVSALWCAVCTVQPLVSSLPSPVSSLQSPVSSLQSPVFTAVLCYTPMVILTLPAGQDHSGALGVESTDTGSR
jgi:hypothetical protein